MGDKIKKLEDLIAWQEARKLARLVKYLKGSEFKGNKFAEPEVEYLTTSNFELKTSN